MDVRQFKRLQDLFEAACGLPPEQWRVFLTARTDDPRGIDEAMALLRRHAEGEARFMARIKAGTDAVAADMLEPTRQRETAIPIGPMQDPLLERVPSVEGHKILGKTVLTERIGSGGMGVVYRGWHLKFRIEVGVKIMKPSLAADPLFVMRFRREAEAALKITHQNVVRVYDVEERHGLHFIVMEFVDGESVPARISRWGRMRQAEAVTMISGVAVGLAEAHSQGLVHRDIKPDNLLLSRSGRVKLADLGLVRLERGKDGATIAGGSHAIVGTPRYMPPEQWDGPHVGPAADIWALGATMFYLLTGEHGVPSLPTMQIGRWIHENPFPSLRDRLPDLRPELCDIFDRCVQPSPKDRFRNGGELHRALVALGMHDEDLLKEEEYRAASRDPDGDGRLTPAMIAMIETRLNEPAVPPKRRRPAPSGRTAASVFLLVALLLGIVVAATFYAARTPRSTRTDEASAPPPREPRAPTQLADTTSLPRPQGAGAAKPVAPIASPPPPPGVDSASKAPASKAGDTGPPDPGASSSDRLSPPILDLADDTDDATPTVRGTTSGATHVEVRVDDHPALPRAQVDGAGRFAVALPPGTEVSNKVSVIAIEGNHRSRPTEASLHDLVKAPRIVWEEPAIGVLLPETVRVQVRVTSFEPVDAVEIDGKAATRLEPEAKGTWFADVTVPPGKGTRVEVKATARTKSRSITSARLGVALHGDSLETTIGIVMRPIPGGNYRIGDPATKVKPEIQVSPFWMDENEVSVGQWRALGMRMPTAQQDARLPVVAVTWDEASEFCQRLTKRERDAGRLPRGYRYALPTEARWEYACRAGTSSPYGIKGFVHRLSDEPAPADEGTPNDFAVRNMHGGVAEWCSDKLPFEYLASTKPTPDPDWTTIPVDKVPEKTVRGGAWTDFPERVTSYSREFLAPTAATGRIGFRVALVPQPTGK